ncbi:MAG TPA: metalloregulator ArsR/SmtB family transcription factor, partial [Candidatus Sulfotelmatobacter sp.]|nr:metalloregulator ArsR/SmtB family transcription factor [Candidatus Sulfotelmatobacter sp.]
MDPELLTTLKALADGSRLRLIGLLASRRMAVEELAQATGLSSPTIAHHLQRLREAGLVTSRPRHPYVEYELRLDALHDIGRRLDAASRPGATEPLEAAGPDGKPRPAFDAKVLAAFMVEGRLTAIPAQEKKRLVVLRYLAETAFEPGVAYPEKEVNQRLGVLHPDTASLRRYLVDLHFMARS